MSVISNDSTLVSLGNGLPAIPEKLMLAHSRGEVLFLVGAGVSKPQMPDFRDLVLSVYKKLDLTVYDVISQIPLSACSNCSINLNGLTAQQSAEVKRFVSREFDVVLGLLERRIDKESDKQSLVRMEVIKALTKPNAKPNRLHKALISLANRGGASTIITTNFDLLLEKAAEDSNVDINSFALGEIPRPSRREDFSGIMHIHGALSRDKKKFSDLVLTDHDFGEFYLRRRLVPDFIYDASRLYNLVLVGYSANDPPMKYLLNSVAADEVRFHDLKDRYVFVGSSPKDVIALEDWKGRGIIPISYDSSNQHTALTLAFEKWSQVASVGSRISTYEESMFKKFFHKPVSTIDVNDIDMLNFILRRSNWADLKRIALMAKDTKAHLSWLDHINQLLFMKN